MSVCGMLAGRNEPILQPRTLESPAINFIFDERLTKVFKNRQVNAGDTRLKAS